MKIKWLFVMLLVISVLTGCNVKEEKNNTFEEKESIEDTPTKVDYDINKELAQIELQAKEIQMELQGDKTQKELNELAKQLYLLWDEEVNTLWNRIIETVDVEYKSAILTEQRTWITNKESEVIKASEKYEGGSMQPLIEYKKAAALTRERSYELALYLGEIVNQSISPLKPEYAGTYVDTEGTMEAYSTLNIVEQLDGTYKVQVDIYRLVSLEGKATFEKGVIKFVDDMLPIQADIIVIDEKATFMVTDSNWGDMNKEDEFLFPEKW